MQLPPSSVPSPSHLLAPLLSSPSLSSLYLFLLTHIQRPSHPSPATLHLQCERRHRIDLDLRLRDLHRSLTALQREEAELKRKQLLLRAFIAKVQRRGEAQRRWVEQLQSISAEEERVADQQQTDEDKENQQPQPPPTPSSAYPAKPPTEVRTKAAVEAAVRLQRRLRETIRTAAPIDCSSKPQSLAPLLSALRQQHIALAVQTQRRLTATKAIEQQIQRLLPSPSLLASLHQVQRNTAATSAILREWQSIRTEGDDGANTRQAVEAERERVRRAEEELAELREEEGRLRARRMAMQARWAEYAQDLARHRTEKLVPAMEALRAALEGSRGCALDEWERARSLPFDEEYRTTVSGVAGMDAVEMSLPRWASAVHAVQAPGPGLAQVLDASGVAWFRSADRILPDLCQQRLQRTVAASALRLQQSRAVQVIAANAALPQLPSLLERSAVLGREHAEMEGKLEGLLKESTALSVEVRRVVRRLRWVRASPALDLLSFVVVEGRTPRQWMDLLSALEERVKAEEVRRKKVMEAQLALADEKRSQREQRGEHQLLTSQRRR